MNHLKHLYNQVKRSIVNEGNMTPEQRKLHQWQFMCQLGDTAYLVGKTGANTMFYRVVVGHQETLPDPITCFPEEMLEVIQSWMKKQYTSYYMQNPSGKIIKTKLKLESLLKQLPLKSMEKAKAKKQKMRDFGIYGQKASGESIHLYYLSNGLKDSVWVEVR